MKRLYFFSAHRNGNYEGHHYESGTLVLDYKIDSHENYVKAIDAITGGLKKKYGFDFGVTVLSLLYEEP